MGNYPISFNTEMMKALLAGTKTQTRRPLKQDGFVRDGKLMFVYSSEDPRIGTQAFFTTKQAGRLTGSQCKYGSAGDILWVKEAFAVVNGSYVYRADYAGTESLRWFPAGVMPFAALRIRLEITKISVERIRDITPDEVRAEGIASGDVQEFSRSWNSCYTGYGLSWEDNPYVWVLGFKKQ